jgi:large subunit ribosomal protein L3
MKKGSLEFWPHRRAIRQMPRVRSSVKTETPSFLGYVGFKAGMTHAMLMDESEGPSKGSEVFRPVTILELPRVVIYGIRFYKKGYAYTEIAGEVYDQNAAKHVGIKSVKKNDISKFKEKINECERVTALAYLDAEPVSIANKRIMRFEIPVGGKTASEMLAFIESFLGKELKSSEVFKPGEMVDTTSITKGKGWAGVVKRYKVATQGRKVTNKYRHLGTLGPWHPAKVQFGVPQAGHMGYNYRTERNKLIIKMGSPSETEEVNVKGGYLNYGVVKSDYIVLDGSIPGPSKRLIRIRKATRSFRETKPPKITYLSLNSKQGK